MAQLQYRLVIPPPLKKLGGILQILTIILHRANARTVLCPFPGLVPPNPCPAMASARAALERAGIRHRAAFFRKHAGGRPSPSDCMNKLAADSARFPHGILRTLPLYKKLSLCSLYIKSFL